MKTLLICFLASLLSACVSMTAVGPGDVTVRDKLVVKLDSAWNKYNGPGVGKTELWTTDGLSLDVLRFFVDIGEGEQLIEVRGAHEKQVPKFRATMQPQEVVELYDAVMSQGGNRFHLDKLAPADFAGGAGFRFDYTLVRKGDEVELKGFCYGVVRDKRLYLMTFQAPKIHYYAQHAQRAQAAALSIRFKG